MSFRLPEFNVSFAGITYDGVTLYTFDGCLSTFTKVALSAFSEDVYQGIQPPDWLLVPLGTPIRGLMDSPLPAGTNTGDTIWITYDGGAVVVAWYVLSVSFVALGHANAHLAVLIQPFNPQSISVLGDPLLFGANPSPYPPGSPDNPVVP
jgi:hypothetical protein